MGLFLLLFVKLVRSGEIETDQPFTDPKFDDMMFLEYAGYYVYYSFRCIFYISERDDFKTEKEFKKYTNNG